MKTGFFSSNAIKCKQPSSPTDVTSCISFCISILVALPVCNLCQRLSVLSETVIYSNKFSKFLQTSSNASGSSNISIPT